MKRQRFWVVSGALGCLLLTSVMAQTGRVNGTAPARDVLAPAAAAAGGQVQIAQPAGSAEAALVTRYCVTCHNQRMSIPAANPLRLDTLDIAHPEKDAETWELVVRKLEAGAMPPRGAARPPAEALDGLVNYLSSSLDRAAAARPDPGRSPARRLNRAEYANAIRDLFGLTVDPAVLLPPDDQAFGFDNIADQLKLSPTLLQRYISAAWTISHVAVGDPALRPDVATYRVRPDTSQRTRMAGLPFGTQGGVSVTHTFPLDAEYEFRIKLWRTAFDNAKIRGLEEPREAEISIDGERVFLGKFGGDADAALDRESPALAAAAVDARLVTKVPVKAGERIVTVTFLKKSEALDSDHLQVFERSTHDVLNAVGVAHLERFSIAGPFSAAAPTGVGGGAASQQQLFTCRPARANEEVACARRILSSVARRAFRREIAAADVDYLMEFYQQGRADGSFALGVASGLRAILSDPDFLLRWEAEPPSGTAEIYRVNDYDLASRLSFFLWSSIPDDELLTLASRRQLRQPDVLDRQVKRMLADARSSALVENFASQWLYLRNLKTMAPDPQLFPDFDDNLRQAMQRETELFVEAIIREDRAVPELLTADFTFINDRLARHYRIPNVVGGSFQRVTLTDPNRFGILGKASTLTVTSYPTRTSPVLRGKWILTQLLGTPPSEPPPDVPALTENGEDGQSLTVRQRMEAHRRNPACAVCHNIMDPLGFALENFNAVGQWRTLGENSQPIDTAGELVDGSKVDGVIALRDAVLRHPDRFVSTFSEKLLTYALGRGVTASDMPALRRIVREAAPGKYRVSSVVLGIVNSTPFQMKRRSETATAATASR